MVVRRSDFVMRWHHDGVVLLAPDCYGPSAEQLGESVCQAIEKFSPKTAEGDLDITVSVGAAWDQTHCGPDFSELLTIAGRELSVAQRRGGNQLSGQPGYIHAEPVQPE